MAVSFASLRVILPQESDSSSNFVSIANEFALVASNYLSSVFAFDACGSFMGSAYLVVENFM